MDLAEGHVAAIDYLEQAGGLLTVNLGTGKGTTVLEMICAFARASGRSIPYQIVGRRPGDIAQCYADPQKANLVLGWQAKRDIDKMCADAWRWQQANITSVE
jgi:UDP-glucose 4-epimerase